MATLVLTTVGSAVGGPIGGAIGGLLGQQVDQNILFKPKPYEGPRLQELTVQTSSYGSQIPRIFGKMRVAGTVIWATDLKEIRESSGGGKGRPSNISYRYSASFAVALSSRRIKSIGRIWADGKIFRGSAGDFKTETGFRFHHGHEDQVVDSFIASAEGPDGTPAYRGLALTVFEDMDLTDYGNRIPSLTFEIIADDGSVTVGSIINDISGEIISGSIAESLEGYSAGGQDRREALMAISEGFSLSFPSVSGSFHARQRQRSEDVPILSLQDHVIATRNGKPVERPETLTLSEAKTPRHQALRYYDPARDYQSGMQNAFRPGQSRAVSYQDFAAAMDAAQAKYLAQAKLWTQYQERSTSQLHILRTALPVKPGALVQWDDSGDIWLVRNWEMDRGTIALSLSKVADAVTKADGATDNGRPVKEPDALAGVTRLALVDLPFAIDDPMQASESSRLYAAAAGDAGWRKAQLFAASTVGGGERPVGEISGPSLIGAAPQPLGSSAAHIIDRKNQLLVHMHGGNMMLNDADHAQLFSGSNLAAIGREIIQFGSANPIGDNRYILSYLLRGLGGTEREMVHHEANEDFILLRPANVMEIDARHYTPFQPVTISAIGRGDDVPVSRSLTDPGRALRPWSPVHARYAFHPNGDLELGWTRRSRAGLLWPDNVATPLGEESEKYRVTIDGQIFAEPMAARTLLSAAEVQAYRIAGKSSLSLEVSQVGQHNISDPLRITIDI